MTIGEEYSNFFDTVLIALAIAQTHVGQYAQARDHAQQGLDLAIEFDNQMCIGRAQMALALAALGEGDVQKAEEHAQTSVTIYTNFGQNSELGMAYAVRGYAACQYGKLDEAQDSFNKALNLATVYKKQIALIYIFVGVAGLLAYQGLAEQAVTSYATIASTLR